MRDDRKTKRQLLDEMTELRADVDRFKLDVDERLRDLARLKLRNERIVDSLPVGIAYLDKDLRCRWANAAFSKLVKRPLAAVIGQGFHEAFPDAGPKVRKLLRQVIATGKPDEPVRLPFVHAIPGRDQATYWDMLALPLLGDGAVVEGVLVALEVTARVEREQLQREQIAKLTELDRLKGDFINMVSHELRTPLSAIAGYAEFLEDNLGGTLTADQRSYVSAIQDAEARIRRIVDDLLDYARIEAGTFHLETEPVDLVEIVRKEIALLVPDATEARVQSELTGASGPLAVRADANRLGQVVLNLVSNAIKFTPAGGSVVVTVSVAHGEALVAVRDTGIGIAPENLPKVFEKFFQVDATSTRERGGAGLGLAISKSLIESQGGEMGVRSEPGAGSTFWFTLPLLAPSGKLTISMAPEAVQDAPAPRTGP